MTTAVFFGFFQADAAEREHERRKRETKQKQKKRHVATTTPKKKENKTKQNKQTEISLRSIIFVYTHIVSIIKDVRVEKILPREERRAGSRARATARLSLGE